MELSLIFAFISAITLLLYDKYDIIESTLETIFKYFFNWSIYQLKIQDMISIIKKEIFILQIGFLIIDLIGFFSFIHAINKGTYYFTISILWIGILEKIISTFIKPLHKTIYSVLVTSIKLAVAIYFNNLLSIVSNICKLAGFLVLHLLLSKIKYIFLKSGLVAIVNINGKEINEDSLKSTLVNILNDIENQLSQLNDNGMQLKQTIKFICNQIIDKIDELTQTINNFVDEINNTSLHLYKFKMIGGFIVCCFLDLSLIIPNWVFYSLIIKILEIIFGSTTAINSMINNSFNILKLKCLKLKKICVVTKLTTSIF